MLKKRKFLGFGFPDEVAKVTSKIGHFSKKNESDWVDNLLPNFDPGYTHLTKSPWLLLPFSASCIILFFIIFIRLFHLQIIEGETNRSLADENRIQIKVIHAQRGVIFDRNGKILAANSPAFRLFEKDLKKVKLISREKALEMEVKKDTRTSDLEVDNVRTYPMAEKFAHVIGYVGEVSQTQLKESGYRLGDRIGQIGIEAQYEKLLKGKDGGEIIEVDSKGVKLRTLRRDPPVPGQNVYLTIDADLQDKVYNELKQALTKAESCCGSAVAMDPANGQILALVSYPSFNPNVFTKDYDEGRIAQIFSQKEAPILNRAISGTYQPGSTFKIVSSLAALSSGKVNASTTILDNGAIFLGPYKFTNWYFTEYGKVEGNVDLVKAIKRSNDIYFYEVGRMIGEGKLIEWAKKLNLGEKLGIDLPAEAEGLVPSDEWKRKTYNQVWYPGDTLHMAIGQGFVLTSPLQVLGITSFIASDGILYKPQLMLTNFKPKILVSNVISADKIELVKRGLKLVPKDGGTAWPFFTFPIPTAGKTGTAEFGDPKGKTHAWYTSFAPAEKAKITLTVLAEAAGEGSNVAAPVAKEVYRWYFSENKADLIKDIYTQ
ncbi:hypothetical protein HYW41_03225 [Candidatus Daviesbacteria bacterium]|nr:hypothetical protein [Candidatus Daviesbacteria bacterium]